MYCFDWGFHSPLQVEFSFPSSILGRILILTTFLESCEWGYLSIFGNISFTYCRWNQTTTCFIYHNLDRR